MYRIGEFSTLAKTTIKTLRYYEKEGLLKPCFANQETGYRYYETKQLVDLAKIISLRQVGIGIKDIKQILQKGGSKEILKKRKQELENELNLSYQQLSKINY